jgi:hypothetical protein
MLTVKFPVRTVKGSTRSEGIVPRIRYFGTKWRCVVSLTPRSPRPIKYVARYVPGPVFTFWKRDKSFISAGIRNQDRPARSLVAILTTQSRLLTHVIIIIIIIIINWMTLQSFNKGMPDPSCVWSRCPGQETNRIFFNATSYRASLSTEVRFAITWSHAQKTIATVFIPRYETVCTKLEVTCGTDLRTPKLAEQTLISQLLSPAKLIQLYCNRVFAATRGHFVTCKSISINSASLCNSSQDCWTQRNMWNPQPKTAEVTGPEHSLKVWWVETLLTVFSLTWVSG